MTSKTKTTIVINFNIEGVHCWSNCNIDEVDYLKNMHRHIFYFNVKIPVKHNDRDIEIISLKNSLIKWFTIRYYDEKYKCCNFKTMSCEDLANELLLATNACEVSVLEDNENGAYVTTCD